MPKRIQRQRKKGWRLPENTVCVTRGTPYGNPYVVGEKAQVDGMEITLTADWAVFLFRRYIKRKIAMKAIDLEPLRGQDVACWCKPECEECGGSGVKHVLTRGNPFEMSIETIAANAVRRECGGCKGSGKSWCHGDVLLELANG